MDGFVWLKIVKKAKKPSYTLRYEEIIVAIYAQERRDHFMKMSVND